MNIDTVDTMQYGIFWIEYYEYLLKHINIEEKLVLDSTLKFRHFTKQFLQNTYKRRCNIRVRRNLVAKSFEKSL